MSDALKPEELVQQLLDDPLDYSSYTIDECRVLQAELRRQHAEIEALRKDAARYRWLRIQDDDNFEFAVVKNPHFDVYDSPHELDAAIDTAMENTK